MSEGRKYDTGDERRYRVNAVDRDERNHMAELDAHRRRVDAQAGSLERQIFRSVMASIARYSNNDDGLF
jgi:hypothetical protein